MEILRLDDTDSERTGRNGLCDFQSRPALMIKGLICSFHVFFREETLQDIFIAIFLIILFGPTFETRLKLPYQLSYQN